jgi:PD-(D/E)XK nuclease superfamily
MNTTRQKCILCDAPLVASKYDKLFLHSTSFGCAVVVTDHLGVSVDDDFEVIDGELFSKATSAVTNTLNFVDPTGEVFVLGEGTYVSAEVGAKKMFEEVGVPFLGGSSGDRGWSSISTFQRCKYLWKQKYGTDVEKTSAPKSAALETGSLTHLFLALRYSGRIHPDYPISPENAKDFLADAGVTPEYLDQAWRLYQSYNIAWGDESWMTPLAVEELATDPHTKFSCRWDLVFRLDAPYKTMLPGVYVCDHKTSSDNGRVTRAQWFNDGGILGQVDLYNRLGYHRRWGTLRGACVNLIVKTKVPQFDRIFVYPPKSVLHDHHKSLRVWSAEMEVAEATGNYPKSRSACVTRGLCDLHDHCRGADGSAPREIEL